MDWIKIVDELPKDGGYVIARKGKHLPCIAMWWSQQRVFSVDGEPISGFTHWMPIPELKNA